MKYEVFKDPGGREENRTRAARFSTMYEQDMTPKHFDELVGAGILSEDGY